MSCTLSLINYSFHIPVRRAIVAKDISDRALFVAICVMHNIAPVVACDCRVCIKVRWQCGGSSLWIKTAANQIIFGILDSEKKLLLMKWFLETYHK